MFLRTCYLVFLSSTTVTLVLACNLQEAGEDSSKETSRLVGNETIPPINEPENATDILRGLFLNYDKRLRPGHAGKPLRITVSLGFLSIGNIHAENMEFNADIYMRQIWNESRLAFGTRDHALIIQHETLDKMWLPDTYFENAVKTHIDQETRTVVLYGDGLILFSQRVTITATTLMNFRAYPMDKQVFKLDILSYGRDTKQLNYRGTNIQLLNKEMSEFVITNQSIENTVKELFMGCFDVLTVKFAANRRVGYYVIRIYFPCTLCTVVSWMAFWMDYRNVGDRGTVGITSLLTQLFLVGNINEAMPRVSYVKAADLFLIVSFAFTFFALLETVIVYKAASSASKTTKKVTPKKAKGNKSRGESYEMTPEPNATVDGVRTNEAQDENSTLQSLARVKIIAGVLVSKTRMGTAWVDRVARVVFPLGYTIFIFGRWMRSTPDDGWSLLQIDFSLTSFVMKPEYDSHGVPKLSLANPRAQVLFPTGQYTYAFGNTPAVALAEHFRTSRTDESLEILLLGSGDVRNLLFTVSELGQRQGQTIPARVSFHLNDHDPSILASDAIILEVARSINPDSELDMDFLWNLWYNLALSSEELKRLQAILENLSSTKYVSNVLKFGSKDVFTECLQIWRDWLRLGLNIDDVSTQRQSLIVFGLNLTQYESQPDTKQENINFLTAVSSLTNTTMKQLFSPFDEQKLSRKCLQQLSPLYQEIYSYFLSGCTSEIQTSSKVNPTLIRPFEHKWKVHYGSCPFSGFIPIDRTRYQNNKSVTKTCKEKLKTLVKNVQRFAEFKSDNPRIKVTFWNGDALELCLKGLPKDALFDLIDTSNLSDHIGLLNILVCCGRRLKEPGQSQLFTSTMLWRASGLSSLEDYLESSLGIMKSLFPTVLGLKLAEDLDLGRSDILTVKESRRIEDRMIWVKTEPERSPISFTRSPDILAALKSMAARCFKLPSPEKRCLQLSGVTLSSPTTFFLAFLQMAATFEEHADQVLNYVEECLPSVRLFQKRSCSKLCCLSWNVLKCVAGLSPGVLIRVEVRVTFPTSALSRNTPVMQVVLFEDPNDARFLKVWPVSQPIPDPVWKEQRTFHRPVHLFSNNVRYDPDQGTVTLLVLEADWQALHVDTVLLLISSSANCTSNAVKLKTGCKTSTNNPCCFANETVEKISKNDREMVEILRTKKRKPRLGQNLSCVNISCVSDRRSSGLQKYDSCYRLEILSSHDVIIHNTGHLHRSTDCLVMEERHSKVPERLFPTGIDSPFYQLKDPLEKMIAGDVVTRNGGDAIEDDSDSKLVTTTKERMDDVSQLFGLRDVTFVTRKKAKTEHLELLALEEHVMCFNADILILRTANTASPIVEYIPKEMPTTVEIRLDNQGTPLKLHFSAPVDEKASKLQLLKDKKKLRCHFPKSEFGVFGQACLKRVPIIDFSTFPKWTSKEDLSFMMAFNQIDEEETGPKKRTAFEEFQNALQSVIASYVECPQKNTCFTIHEPTNTEENPPNFTIVVQEVFCHRQVPLAKVLFCDHSVTAFPSEGSRNSASSVKYREFLKQMMAERKESPMIHVTKEGQVLLKRLLYTNAKRVKQTDTLSPVWMDSILQLRFQEENTQLEIQD